MPQLYTEPTDVCSDWWGKAKENYSLISFSLALMSNKSISILWVLVFYIRAGIL